MVLVGWNAHWTGVDVTVGWVAGRVVGVVLHIVGISHLKCEFKSSGKGTVVVIPVDNRAT